MITLVRLLLVTHSQWNTPLVSGVYLTPGKEAEVFAAAVAVRARVAAGVPVLPEDVEVAEGGEGVLLQGGVHQLHLGAGAVRVHPGEEGGGSDKVKVTKESSEG